MGWCGVSGRLSDTVGIEELKQSITVDIVIAVKRHESLQACVQVERQQVGPHPLYFVKIWSGHS